MIFKRVCLFVCLYCFKTFLPTFGITQGSQIYGVTVNNDDYTPKAFLKSYLSNLEKCVAAISFKNNSKKFYQSKKLLLRTSYPLSLKKKGNPSTPEYFVMQRYSLHNACKESTFKFQELSPMLCKMYLKRTKAKTKASEDEIFQDISSPVKAKTASMTNVFTRRKRQIPSYPLGIFLPPDAGASLPIDLSSLTGNIGFPGLLDISNLQRRFELPHFTASNSNKFQDPPFSHFTPFSSSDALFPSDFSLKFPALSSYLSKKTSNSNSAINSNFPSTPDAKNVAQPLPKTINEASTLPITVEASPLTSSAKKGKLNEDVEDLLDKVESKFSADQSDIKSIYHSIPGTGPTKVDSLIDSAVNPSESNKDIVKIESSVPPNNFSANNDPNLSIFINSDRPPNGISQSHHNTEEGEDRLKLIPLTSPSAPFKNPSGVQREFISNYPSPLSEVTNATYKNLGEFESNTLKNNFFSNQQSKSNSHNDLLLDMFLDQREVTLKEPPINSYLKSSRENVKKDEKEFLHSDPKFLLSNTEPNFNVFKGKLNPTEIDTEKLTQELPPISKPHFQL